MNEYMPDYSTKYEPITNIKEDKTFNSKYKRKTNKYIPIDDYHKQNFKTRYLRRNF